LSDNASVLTAAIENNCELDLPANRRRFAGARCGHGAVVNAREPSSADAGWMDTTAPATMS